MVANQSGLGLAVGNDRNLILNVFSAYDNIIKGQLFNGNVSRGIILVEQFVFLRKFQVDLSTSNWIEIRIDQTFVSSSSS